MSAKLTQISIEGFKTYKTLSSFSPGRINLLVGANGAGKSNFISFFRMLAWMMADQGKLQEFVGKYGRASLLLHDGPKKTGHMEMHLSIETESGLNDYAFRLAYAAGDSLVFTDERYRYLPENPGRRRGGEANWTSLGAGHAESRLIERAKHGQSTAKTIRNLLQGLVVYQFHDTSFLSRMRGAWSVDDGRWLKEDGGNLAAFLHGLMTSPEEEDRVAFVRIETISRRVIPFFSEFKLEPYAGQVSLQWGEQGTDMVFGASQASDGMLRTIALLALLGQPPKRLSLSHVLFLDEPELGLHPYAINLVAVLIQEASKHAQIFVATQSPLLVDAFGIEDVVIVNRAGRESQFKRNSAQELSEWMSEYSLGELWRKNVLGGGPVA